MKMEEAMIRAESGVCRTRPDDLLYEPAAHGVAQRCCTAHRYIDLLRPIVPNRGGHRSAFYPLCVTTGYPSTVTPTQQSYSVDASTPESPPYDTRCKSLILSPPLFPFQVLRRTHFDRPYSTAHFTHQVRHSNVPPFQVDIEWFVWSCF